MDNYQPTGKVTILDNRLVEVYRCCYTGGLYVATQGGYVLAKGPVYPRYKIEQEYPEMLV